MATIGLVQRPHREFVAEWDEPDAAIDVERSLLDTVNRSLTAAGVDRRARRGRPAADAMTRDDVTAEAWLVGEPTF